MLVAALLASVAVVSACKKTGETTAGPAGESVKVGVLHSLSGTMAISEVTVKNSTQMAIDEINAAGGVMGKKVEAVTEDGASDPATFAQKATKLIDGDGDRKSNV
jgi:urea transport system substrate-binding protein